MLIRRFPIFTTEYPFLALEDAEARALIADLLAQEREPKEKDHEQEEAKAKDQRRRW